MYISDERNYNNYQKIITNLQNCNSFTGDILFDLLIEIIINADIQKYISEDIKYKVCEYIIKTFYKELKIEKKIDFLLKIKSNKLRENTILINFPKLDFADILAREEKTSLIYLKYFIEKNILDNNEFLSSLYFKELILKCNTIKKKLERKEITFAEVIQLKKLNEKLLKRIYFICLGDSKTSSTLKNEIENYIKEYIYYNSQLYYLIRYYRLYKPNSKKEEIIKYSQQQTYFEEATINICEIKLDKSIYSEIEIFDKYEKSKLFGLLYHNLEIKYDIQEELNEEELKKREEDIKFEKTIENFNKLINLFNEKDLDLEFL